MTAKCVALPLACLLGLLVQGSLSAHENHGVPAASPERPLERSWTSQPLIMPVGKPDRSGISAYAVQGASVAQVELLSPDIQQPVAVVPGEGGRWQIAPVNPKVGGHHWVIARETTGGAVRVASTVISFPVPGPSPEARLAEVRRGLEVLPLRLPDRGGFREGQVRGFKVRLDGQPQGGLPVVLETENGSRQEALTGADGVAELAFPHDFSTSSIDPNLGVTRSRKAYVVSVAMDRDGVRYQAAFNQFYHPDLMRERSLAWGAGFAVLGMLLALPLLRRKEKSHA